MRKQFIAFIILSLVCTTTATAAEKKQSWWQNLKSFSWSKSGQAKKNKSSSRKNTKKPAKKPAKKPSRSFFDLFKKGPKDQASSESTAKTRPSPQKKTPPQKKKSFWDFFRSGDSKKESPQRSANSAPAQAPRQKISTKLGPGIKFSANVARQSVVKLRADYDKSLKEIARKRGELLSKIAETEDPAEKKKIIAESREYITKTLTDIIFPAWYGTDWDYNGMTDKPGKGSVACGHFVSIVIDHVGFKVDRVALGQQNSPTIIKSLTDQSTIKKMWKTSLEKFLAEIRKMGKGVYLVGMDTHVGFLVYDGKKTALVHSSGFVRAQNPYERHQLSVSQWRMVGKMLDDNSIKKWLNAEEFVLKK